MVPADKMAATSEYCVSEAALAISSSLRERKHTGVLETSDERASPHDYQEDNTPVDSAEIILSDSVDGGLSCVDMETPESGANELKANKCPWSRTYIMKRLFKASPMNL